ncbi:hypothetical protein [Adhaeribacter soli]|uniref:Uncharacterized protein n=1 Tax=Adhaeribacter soli TaxID=2607655 RepID=A0A5N1IPH5_9BACT|nr:hypothetical protein [Adhaeribacter soli]KAA9331861.1 hypothetical protein F0P94_13770 [Adhaeribacter soli]
MKKLRNFYLSMLAVASLGLMTSCGDDNDDPQPAPPAPKEMNTFTAKILGNQQATPGSFFASTTGDVINSTNSKANAAIIDFGYYFSVAGDVAPDSATIAAPNDANGAKVFGAITSADYANWTKKNATMFKDMGANEALFTAATNGDEVAAIYTNMGLTPSSSVKHLNVGDVFSFKTEAGKHGIAKVTALTKPTNTATQSVITIDVKVEK